MIFLTSSPTVSDELQQELGEQTSFFQQLLAEIDWQKIGVRLAIIGFQLLLTLVVFFLISRIGTALIKTTFKQYRKQKTELSSRYQTIYNLTLNSFRGVLFFAFVYTALTLFHIPVGTLLAGAGVLGLAVSFGAQGFVADLVNGLSILLENQLDIGDEIKVGEIEGIVINVNLKTIQVRGFDGTIHFIPNRQIQIVSNRSKEDMRSLIELKLTPEADFEGVENVLRKVTQKYIDTHDNVTSRKASIHFVLGAANERLARVTLFTRPGQQYTVEAELTEWCLEALTNAGYHLD